MMKKVAKLIVLSFVLLSLICLSATLQVRANEDGNLKINTDIHSKKSAKDIQYIEQENELSKLFYQDITNSIRQKQADYSQVYQSEKNRLFIKEISVEKASETYLPLLFTLKTTGTKTDYYAVTLDDNPPQFSWQMGILLCLGVSVTLYSMGRVVISNRKNTKKGRA